MSLHLQEPVAPHALAPKCPACGVRMVLTQGTSLAAQADLEASHYVWWHCPNCNTCGAARKIAPPPPQQPRFGGGRP